VTAIFAEGKGSTEVFFRRAKMGKKTAVWRRPRVANVA
jgi:hypothetical protein